MLLNINNISGYAKNMDCAVNACYMISNAAVDNKL